MCGSLPSPVESVCLLQTQGLAGLGDRCTLAVKHGDRTRNDRFCCFYCSFSVPDVGLTLRTETPAQCLCFCFFMLDQGGAGVQLPFLLLPAPYQSLFSPPLSLTHPLLCLLSGFLPSRFPLPILFPQPHSQVFQAGFIFSIVWPHSSWFCSHFPQLVQIPQCGLFFSYDP